MFATPHRAALANAFASRISASGSRHTHPSMMRLDSNITLGSPFASSYLCRRTYTAARVRRMAIGALAVVAFIATALVLHAWSSTADSTLPTLTRPPTYTIRNAAVQQPHAGRHRQPKTQTSARADFQFAAPADELGALIGFITAFASNSLPPNVDPTQSLNPELVLEFDPRDPAMRGEVREAVREAWKRNPVVVLSELKMGRPATSREVKSTIQALNLHPDPTIIEVDQRVDSEVTHPLLKRLTGADALPIVIIGGQPIRSMDEFRSLVEAGTLNDLITAAGAKINGKKVKHGRKH